MYIHEAIASTTSQKPFITRRSWDMDGFEQAVIKILPTNTPDCCLIVSDFSSHGARRGWEPSAKDLVADDWYTCSGSLSPKESRNKRK